MKILIVRFSSMGDMVLTTPVVRCVKEQVKSAELHYAAKAQYNVLLESNPYIDKIHVLDNNWKAFIRKLKEEQFDYVVDLHHNLRTARLKLALGKPSSSFYKANIPKWLMTNFKINRLPDVHIVDRYMDTVKPLHVYNDNKGLDFFIPEQDQIGRNELGISKEEKYIAFAIGGQFATKKLPHTKMSSICNALSLPVVLLGGKEDMEAAQNVVHQVTNNRVIDMTGKLNINQSASVAQQAAVVLAHDTGMMHISAALKKNIVSIWGNTDPVLGMYPYQTTYRVAEVKNLSCRPCSKIGYAQCPKKHFRCMQDMSVTEIVQYTEELLH